MAVGPECWPPSALWDYALALYAAPGVEAACLALQDRCGADVNLVLFACWVGAGGRQVDAERLAEARDEALAWQTELVGPLRAARRGLKQRLPGLAAPVRARLEVVRTDLARSELALERGELLLLEGLAGPGAAGTTEDSPASAVSALTVLTTLGPAAKNELHVILAAAFPGRRPADLALSLAAAPGFAQQSGKE